MDTVLSHGEIQRRKKRKAYVVAGGVVVLAITVFALRLLISPSVKRHDILTAQVTRGNIENTLTASGELLPEFEQVLTSPITSSVQRVLTEAGTPVKAGQLILTLDKASALADYEKLKFQLESKRNTIRKLQLELEKSFGELKSNNDIKQLRIGSLKASVENARRLFKAGGGTREDISQAELNLEVAQVEKKQLETEILSKQKTMQLEMRESEIAAAIQENELKELARKLQQADMIAARSGVITWVNRNIGATIREGEAVARIADLASYKVAGTISDSYAGQFHIGTPAIIRINDAQLRGAVTNISPSVQNGLVSFDVRPDEQGSKLFRPNLKAEVFLVTDTRSRVLMVPNGAAFKGGEAEDIFVIHGNQAERRTVATGLSNFDFMELKSGVKEGDVVIISDMSVFKNSKEIKIKD